MNKLSEIFPHIHPNISDLIEKVSFRYGKSLGKIKEEYSGLRMNAVVNKPSLRILKDLNSDVAVEETRSALE